MLRRTSDAQYWRRRHWCCVRTRPCVSVALDGLTLGKRSGIKRGRMTLRNPDWHHADGPVKIMLMVLFAMKFYPRKGKLILELHFIMELKEHIFI